MRVLSTATVWWFSQSIPGPGQRPPRWAAHPGLRDRLEQAREIVGRRRWGAALSRADPRRVEMPVRTSMECQPRPAAPSMSVSRRSRPSRGLPAAGAVEGRLEDRRVRLADHLARHARSSPRSPPAGRRPPATRCRRARGRRCRGSSRSVRLRASTSRQPCAASRSRRFGRARPPRLGHLGAFGHILGSIARIPAVRRASRSPSSPITTKAPGPRREPASGGGRQGGGLDLVAGPPTPTAPSRPTTARAWRLALFVTNATPLPAARMARDAPRRRTGSGSRRGRAPRPGRTGTRRTRRSPSRSRGLTSCTPAAIQGGCPASPRSRHSSSTPRSPVRSTGSRRPAVRRHQRPSPASTLRRARSASCTSTSRRAPTTRPHPESRYARAAQLLADWERDGAPWSRLPEPLYFAYEMRVHAWMGADARSIRGLVCAMDLEPLEDGSVVLPHEHVMPGPVEDRLRLLRATAPTCRPSTARSPVPSAGSTCAACDRGHDADLVIDRRRARRAATGCGRSRRRPRSRTWLAAEPLLIADGHHRYTTALQYRDERQRRSTAPGPGTAC